MAEATGYSLTRFPSSYSNGTPKICQGSATLSNQDFPLIAMCSHENELYLGEEECACVEDS